MTSPKSFHTTPDPPIPVGSIWDGTSLPSPQGYHWDGQRYVWVSVLPNDERKIINYHGVASNLADWAISYTPDIEYRLLEASAYMI